MTDEKWGFALKSTIPGINNDVTHLSLFGPLRPAYRLGLP